MLLAGTEPNDSDSQIRKSMAGAKRAGKVDWLVVNRSADTWSCGLISVWVNVRCCNQ